MKKISIILILIGACFCEADSGPVAYWSFDQLEGDVIRDNIGAAHGRLRTDMLMATSTPVEHAGWGKSLRLNNHKLEHALYPQRGYVELVSGDVLDFGYENFLVAGWFRSGQIEGGHEFLLSRWDKTGGLAIYLGRHDRSYRGKLIFEVKGLPKSKSVRSDVRLDDDKWHFFAATVRCGEMFIYVDGLKQAGTDKYEDGTTTCVEAYVKGYIGQDYNGEIDELAVWGRAVSEKEIVGIYKDGLREFVSTEPLGIGPEYPQIKIRERMVFDGLKGWEHEGVMYRLACGAMITQAANGDLLSWWITGTENEPSSDNCAVLTRSKDMGKTWSEPEMFVPAQDNMMVVVSNVYPVDEKRLAAFWALLPWDKSYTEWHYRRMYSADNGNTWGTAEKFTIRDNKASLFEGPPLRLTNGKYLFAGTFFDKRPLPLVAPRSELVKARSEAEALAMPKGEGVSGGVYAEYVNGCMAFIADEKDGGGWREAGGVANRPLGLIEPTCLQLKDGRLVMLMRAQYDGYLWRSESRDNGRSWSEAVRTDIANPSTMAHLVRLPDGRIVLIHNHTSKSRRDPLSLWVSDDEMESWYIKADILHGGMMAYPHGLVLADGRLVFVYDHNRRQVRFVEVECISLNQPVRF